MDIKLKDTESYNDLYRLLMDNRHRYGNGWLSGEKDHLDYEGYACFNYKEKIDLYIYIDVNEKYGIRHILITEEDVRYHDGKRIGQYELYKQNGGYLNQKQYPENYPIGDVSLHIYSSDRVGFTNFVTMTMGNLDYFCFTSDSEKAHVNVFPIYKEVNLTNWTKLHNNVNEEASPSDDLEDVLKNIIKNQRALNAGLYESEKEERYFKALDLCAKTRSMLEDIKLKKIDNGYTKKRTR